MHFQSITTNAEGQNDAYKISIISQFESVSTLHIFLRWSATYPNLFPIKAAVKNYLFAHIEKWKDENKLCNTLMVYYIDEKSIRRNQTEFKSHCFCNLTYRWLNKKINLSFDFIYKYKILNMHNKYVDCSSNLSESKDQYSFSKLKQTMFIQMYVPTPVLKFRRSSIPRRFVFQLRLIVQITTLILGLSQLFYWRKNAEKHIFIWKQNVYKKSEHSIIST